MKEIYISPELKKIEEEILKKCTPFLEAEEKISEQNQVRVLSAFINNNISESHLHGTTGYGYDDRGRDTLDCVYADIFGTEDALVRHNFVSGTHALSTALFGVLRPNDLIVSVTGKPYDTLEEVIGLRGEGGGSLKDFGVKYGQVDLKNGKIDIEGVKAAAVDAKVIYVQRSRGYSLRPSITVAEIGECARAAKSVNPNVIVMVDNCYGEFSEECEPTHVGADMAIGSLIKNPGGGIAKTGGYIVGSKHLIEMCANRLTCCGMGKEEGCSLEENRSMYLGLFFAPKVVGEAIKTAIFASALLQRFGCKTYPSFDEKRTDIITAIELGSPERMIAFCQGIQSGSPIDAFASPEPWDMPGYDSKVIMAAGAFTTGASIELSADGPIREPYAVWMQGGLTFATGRIGVLLAVQKMLDQGLITIE